VSTPDILALSGLACLCAGFYFTRRSLLQFIVLGCSLLLFFWALLYALGNSDSGPSLVAGTALALCWLGLLGIMTMLRRSVSLQLLAALSTGEVETDGAIPIGGRLADGVALGLMEAPTAEYRLTARGRFIALLVRLLYALARV